MVRFDIDALEDPRGHPVRCAEREATAGSPDEVARSFDAPAWHEIETEPVCVLDYYPPVGWHSRSRSPIRQMHSPGTGPGRGCRVMTLTRDPDQIDEP